MRVTGAGAAGDASEDGPGVRRIGAGIVDGEITVRGFLDGTKADARRSGAGAMWGISAKVRVTLSSGGGI